MVLVLLAGCGQKRAGAASADPRLKAETVPLVAAQALTLRFELGHSVGLQEVGQQDAASLLVKDVDGYPLEYLTVLGPEARGGFWEAARAAAAAGEGHYLVATGASSLYSPTLFADTGTDTLEHLLSAVDALGGEEQVERVVSFSDPGRYYLVDRSGNYYDAYTGEAVSAGKVAELSKGFHEMVARLGQDEDYLANNSLVWRCLLGEASEEECSAEDASAEAVQARQSEAELLSQLGYDPVALQSAGVQPQAAGMGLAAMTGADGELDFGKAQEVIEQGGAGNFTDYEGVSPQWRKKSCLGWFCYGEYWVLEARQGKTDEERNANPVDKDEEWHTVGGNWQSVSQYGYKWKDYFNSGNNGAYDDSRHFPDKFNDSDWRNLAMHHLFDPAINDNLPIGCGPAAFIRLATWFGFERLHYIGKGNVRWYHVAAPSWPINYHITDESYMYWKNNWLGGRMLKFNKIRYHNGNHYTYLYQADLPNKMQTKAIDGQGLTFPGPFMTGANAWLAERGSNLRLHGGGYVFTLGFLPYIGFAIWNSEVWKMYREAMGSIGLRNEPGVALHPYGGGAFHYSPTLEARLYNWRVKADVLIRVNWTEGSSFDGKFVLISRYNAIAGGFYALR